MQDDEETDGGTKSDGNVYKYNGVYYSSAPNIRSVLVLSGRQLSLGGVNAIITDQKAVGEEEFIWVYARGLKTPTTFVEGVCLLTDDNIRGKDEVKGGFKRLCSSSFIERVFGKEVSDKIFVSGHLLFEGWSV